MRRLLSVFGIAIGVILCAVPSIVAAQSHSELQSMVEQLRSNPSDAALKERIVETARRLDPQPAIPEEARRHFIKGTTIAQSATDPAGQALAVKSFEEALKIAPWWGEAWYNLAVAQELAGQMDSARTSLRLYILTGPEGEEARKAQDRIYALEAKQELANEPGAREKRFLDSLDGAIFTYRFVHSPYCDRRSLIVRGREVVDLQADCGEASLLAGAERGRMSLGRVMTRWDEFCGLLTYTINNDGRTISKTYRCGRSPPKSDEYVRAR